MAIKLIVGKPGSGKSYHACSCLAEDLRDFINYELREGEPYPRKLFTNLPLDVSKLNILVNDGLSPDHEKYVDVGRYVVLFDKKHTSTYWEHTEKNALIYLDEAQLAFPEEATSEEVKELNKRLSIHRHNGEDIYLITQHQELMHKSVLKTTEMCMDIINFKATRIPILNIPLSDVQIVLESFGFKNQSYIVTYGIFKGRAVKWTEGSQTHVMKQSIFDIYNSHSVEGGLGGASGDRPSLKMNRKRSLLWFLGRHGSHLGFKFLLAIGFIALLLMIVSNGPAWMGDLAKNSVQLNGKALKKENKPSSNRGASTNKHTSLSQNKSAAVIDQLKEIKLLKKKLVSKDKEIEVLKDKVLLLLEGKKIRGVFKGGVILANGTRYDVGETITFDGDKKYVIESVNHVIGVVVLDDGTIVRVR